MEAVLTLKLPEDISSSLDQAADQEGIGRDELAIRALKDFLFLRRFRTLRERMMAESDRSYTDEEVFDLVS